ncbi:MAG TPA: lipopolysaccharide kinase InaA family protein [Verrucomicrobiota bacterium]|jgi:tRNA A-37 threonylcarbamoyl transferase component Bud32|nr:lipopolysaccharide kinase InaA family protein [Verrucomicrobiota bacterium]HQL79131.1 lipopolysaccharide kinase InaA family protein [Verrucomicrobiota bacterium]
MKPRVEQTQNAAADPVRRITVGRWRWEVLGAHATPAMQPVWASPDPLVKPPAERVVRDPPSRTTEVFRARLPAPGGNVFIKRYLANPWQSFKRLFRRSKAVRSFRIGAELQRLGIPTAPPVAAGERRVAGWLRDAWLVTEEIPDARTWFECDRSLAQGTHRVPLFRALARCFAKLHDAGLSHSDANRNNLLIQFPAGPRPKLYLIDLDALVRRPWFTQRRAVKDLRRLLTRGPATTRERLWFLAEYCRARKAAPNPRGLLRRLDGGVLEPVAPVRAGPLCWVVRPALLAEDMLPVLRDPDSHLREAALRLKHSRNVTLARIPRQVKTGWVLRRLNYGKLLHRLRDCLRSSRARRAFRHGLWLEQAGVATAGVLAAGERRRLRWPLRAYLLMEEIPGAITLAALIEQNHPQLEGALRRLGQVLARLHDAGFSHRDLKATNVLFDAQLQPHLIDLDGVRRVRFAARSRAVADLARLARDAAVRPAVPVRYAVLFLKAYCRHRGLADWCWWWRAIQARLQG